MTDETTRYKILDENGNWVEFPNIFKHWVPKKRIRKAIEDTKILSPLSQIGFNQYKSELKKALLKEDE